MHGHYTRVRQSWMEIQRKRARDSETVFLLRSPKESARDSETVFLPRSPKEGAMDSETVFLLRTNYWIHLQRRYYLLLKIVLLTRLLMRLNFAPKCPFH